jgi:hypothetical protein
MIDDYIVTLTAAGQPATSLALRRIQLVRMARDLGGHPTDVTAETLVAWFGNCTGWRTETRRNYRADELPKVRERRGAPRPAPDHAWQSALAVADARTTIMLRLAGEAGLRRGEVARVHTRDLLA